MMSSLFQRTRFLITVFRCCVVLTAVIALLFSSSSVSSSNDGTPDHPFSPRNIRSFIRKRTNDNTVAYWAYEGYLTDPFTGERIAACEGFEIVRSLQELTNDYNQYDNNGYNETITNSLDGLRIKNILNCNEKDWNYSNTILSRKLFAYRDDNCESDGRRGTQVLKSIRLRLNGKPRTLRMDEAVSLYDTATTFISSSSCNKSENGNINDGNNNDGMQSNMDVVVEWPDGRFIAANAKAVPTTSINDYGPNTQRNQKFCYSTYAKRRSSDDDLRLPSVTVSLSQGMNKNSSMHIPRRKLVQFGKDDRSLEQSRYGALEGYSFDFADSDKDTRQINTVTNLRRWIRNKLNNDMVSDDDYHTRSDHYTKSGDVVRYSRYGECPPWYGPSKMCSLEMVGRRVDSLLDAPPLAAQLASQVPGFASVATPVSIPSSNANDYKRRLKEAITWFKTDTLKRHTIEDVNANMEILTKMQNWWSRIRDATKISEGDRS